MVRFVCWLAVAAALALAAGAAVGAVNINTAVKDDLVALPGIGPAKAQAILDYRRDHGPFKSVDDLKQVKGVRSKLVEQLRPELTVTGGASRAHAPKGESKTVAAPPGRTDAGRIAKEEKRP